MTDIEKDKARLSSRLDEAAREHHEKIDTGFVSVDHHKPAFKAGTRYGIEWVIEELERHGSLASKLAAKLIRKMFAPILERGYG